MREVLIFTKNVLKLIFRKKSNIVVFMLLPILSIFISQFLNGKADDTIKIGICDEDKTTVSKDITNYLNGKEKFKVYYVDRENIEKCILNEEVNSVIVLDKGFEDKIIDGSFKKLQMKSIKGAETTIWQENYINYYISDILDIGKSSNGDREKFTKVYNEFLSKESSVKKEKVKDVSNSMGVSKQSIAFLLVIMLSGATTAAGTIAKDKADRVFRRILTSPIKIYKYILGNSIANFIMNLIQIGIIVIAAKILNMNFGMNFLEVFLILGVFSLVSVSLGMFISAISSSTNQVSQIANAIIIPTSMISGCFWPIEFMPNIMQNFALILPQTWIIKIVNELQNGKNLNSILVYFIPVILFAIVLYIFAIINIKKDGNNANYI